MEAMHRYKSIGSQQTQGGLINTAIKCLTVQPQSTKMDHYMALPIEGTHKLLEYISFLPVVIQ
jgi:hypothetical protein